MRIAILILYTESWQPLANIVLPVAQDYCDKNGYELVVKKYSEPFESDFGFNKIIEIQKLFKRGNDNAPEAVWSLDLDTIITNHSIKIEKFINEHHSFYYTKDFNGINCGSFIVTKSDWSTRFLEYMLLERGKEGMHCEQNAVESFLKYSQQEEEVYQLWHPTINSYKYELYPEIPLQSHEQGNWNPGDLLLHLPGIGMHDRLKILTEVKEQIIYE